jgi:hypothetical protein
VNQAVRFGFSSYDPMNDALPLHKQLLSWMTLEVAQLIVA